MIDKALFDYALEIIRARANRNDWEEVDDRFEKGARMGLQFAYTSVLSILEHVANDCREGVVAFDDREG